jgi:tRNA A37 threonylcarbamoyltransferase TsaD
MKNNEERRKNVDVYFGLRGALTTFKEMLNAKDAEFLSRGVWPQISINTHIEEIESILKKAYEKYELRFENVAEVEKNE